MRGNIHNKTLTVISCDCSFAPARSSSSSLQCRVDYAESLIYISPVAAAVPANPVGFVCLAVSSDSHS